jgi:predicted enzyme related to lactoylglutathione lyase
VSQNASPRIALHEITLDCTDVPLVSRFWSVLLTAELREPLPGWRRLGPLTFGGPLLNFQPVPEAKAGKSRMHLDLLTDDLAAAVARVVQLGGSDSGERHDYDEGSVVVMADPEGHEFCLVAYTACPPPPPSPIMTK